MKNYYPEKPVLEYRTTSVNLNTVVEHLKNTSYPVEVKRSTYIIFRNESGNGNKGLNNNYGGFQADSGRWEAKYDSKISGVVLKTENKQGTRGLKTRWFLAFFNWESSIDMLADKIHKRGLYVGGDTYLVVKEHVDTPEELALIYKREWVTGDPKAKFDVTIDANERKREIEKDNFLSMYKQSSALFL